jgi:hypothetical protein
MDNTALSLPLELHFQKEQKCIVSLWNFIAGRNKITSSPSGTSFLEGIEVLSD